MGDKRVYYDEDTKKQYYLDENGSRVYINSKRVNKTIKAAIIGGVCVIVAAIIGGMIPFIEKETPTGEIYYISPVCLLINSRISNSVLDCSNDTLSNTPSPTETPTNVPLPTEIPTNTSSPNPTSITEQQCSNGSNEGAYLYEHAFFEGRSIFIAPGMSVIDLSDTDWNFNDTASSLCINGEYRVKLCKHANFSEPCYIFETDDRNFTYNDLGNDSTSSVIVEAR